jgi:hypothetical protein
MRPIHLVAVTITLAAVVVGCGSEGGALGDGRHFGYVRSVDTSSEPATIEFDVAEFLTGEAANDAAVDDGAIEEGEGVPNDYYVRNDDESVEILTVSPDVTVTRVRCPAGCEEGAAGDFDGFAASFGDEDASFADEYRGAHSQYWVTVEDDEVAVIDEQYLP